MSLEFSQEYEAPIVTTSLTPLDDGEVSLRPKTLDDYTGQEKAKGNLSVYIEAAKRLGADVTNCIFIDDNVNAVKTAKAAGMHSWGIFDKSSADYVDEMKEISEKYIYTFSEI